ncbi:MAG: ATP-binding protein [Butyrivibrio sp.]|uniref:MATE family efflux transporter n=1 Tax=Butyrivibrio sp. TaxID=28121 RepID=UPI0025B9DE3D|nr:MATE family efflux transporter [Butyrivibrio sp.]MBQ6588863.1 ATP-binding protein [Butyrivibrio sp.]
MKNKTSMSSVLFFKLLPVQIMVVAMGSINSIVDGIIAGRFIDAVSVGVIGLFYAIVLGLNAAGSVLLGGSSVLSGRYIGSGNIDKTSGIFSLTVNLTAIISILVSSILLVFPGAVAAFCGADETLKASLITYISGYGIGVFPMMMSQQLAAFLQLERQSKRNYIGIATMIICNITLNIALVAVFNMGIFGLALSTSICNWIYFIILVTYYFGKKSQLKYSFRSALWGDAWNMLKIGFPGALLVLCLSFRDVVLNRIILNVAGQDGMSAKSALGMVGGLFIALCLGTGTVVRTLGSVHVGEEDRDSIKELIKLGLTKVLILSCIIAVVVMLLSGAVVRIFFADPTSNVFKLAHQYFIIYAASIPLIQVVQVETNYLQAMGKNTCVNAFSVIDGFASVVLPALILAPIIGILGVWLATPIGIVISAFVYPVYAIIHWRRIPRNVNEWLLFDDGFGVKDEDRLAVSITNMEDVTNTAELVQGFCKKQGYDNKVSLYAALCLEEMARNVIEYGFTSDNKKHYLETRVVSKDDCILLRIKDDCIPFDPVSMKEQLRPEDTTKNIGIKMVMKLADETNYQNLLGLNVLTITIDRAKTKM